MSPRGTKAASALASTDRAPLDRAAVLRAALDLANAEGVEAVTFRRIAEVLSVTPMALYRHVSNKSDLLEGIFLLIVEEAAVIDHEHSDWREWVCRVFVKMGEAMLRQRGIMGLLERSETQGRGRAEVAEAIFRRLCEAGFTPRQAAELQRDLNRYIFGAVALDQSMPGTPGSPDHERHLRARLELLPSSEFPVTTRHAAEIASSLANADIERGVRRIIAAFERECRVSRAGGS